MEERKVYQHAISARGTHGRCFCPRSILQFFLHLHTLLLFAQLSSCLHLFGFFFPLLWVDEHWFSSISNRNVIKIKLRCQRSLRTPKELMLITSLAHISICVRNWKTFNTKGKKMLYNVVVVSIQHHYRSTTRQELFAHKYTNMPTQTHDVDWLPAVPIVSLFIRRLSTDNLCKQHLTAISYCSSVREEKRKWTYHLFSNFDRNSFRCHHKTGAFLAKNAWQLRVVAADKWK